jgi:carbamoyl-phosphate synthase small subunit
MKAVLALEDGKIFEGEAFGAQGETFGEMVFNTSMTGYQEIITDPSYKGQIVAMTYPLIGNYGVNSEDVESFKPHLEGFVVKELSKISSNWRSEKGLDEYLAENGVVGIEGVDTRALTKHLRTRGAMKAVLSTNDLDHKSLIEKAKKSQGLVGRNLVKEVTCPETYEFICEDYDGEPELTVVAIDCGIKYNMARILVKKGCRVFIVPAGTSTEEVLSKNPDGVLLSNGPGDPEPVTGVIETARGLIGKVPMFGICLGHQILGLAYGGQTYKLKFGHRGANQPVKFGDSHKIDITSQNHGFCVDLKSLDESEIETTHVNLNDMTVEGMRHRKHPIFSVQYHPEACPGPHDAEYLFDEFIESMRQNKSSNALH